MGPCKIFLSSDFFLTVDFKKVLCPILRSCQVYKKARSTPLETREVDEWQVYLDCDNPVEVALTFSFGFGAPSLVPVFPTAMQIPVHFSTLLSSSTPHSISAKQFFQRQSQL